MAAVLAQQTTGLPWFVGEAHTVVLQAQEVFTEVVDLPRG
ncbi:hypothetical protein SAMN05216266_14517 [Amycolatopsis marina]|uniref:Uncharacterized protein n=2 Tax=Amycolatopsis TaxID=1813 RepID=A0A1I1CR89_9PSEU|nr:hypothetical protein [Amycolatopsis roodepoortensis]TWE14996.1 hypothetical protein FHX69_7166 [Prauserella muralis]SDU62801.1 hypothetical protein SAMN04489733_7281 [Amycolatopsis keratiniphila]SFB64612.1 hypothetical protein SAMN05216266_14517 [Amycolatopsis marina]